MMNKVAVMIMATDKQPSVRNIEGIKDTYISCYNRVLNGKGKKWKHQFDFFVYTSDPTIQVDYICTDDANVDNLHYVKVKEVESVYRTFEKTFKMYQYLDKEHRGEYKCYIRTNISMMLNLYMLDAYIDRFKPGTVYCNAVNSHTNAQSPYMNDLYPRGDLMIFDQDVMDCVLRVGEKYMYCDQDMHERIGVDHVDDCLMGVCMVDAFGPGYYTRIKPIKYYYLPKDVPTEVLTEWRIGYRVKTLTPEAKVSGYSWDDNEFRRLDVEKMKILQAHFDEHQDELMKLKDVQLGDILVNIYGNEQRPTLFLQTVNVGLNVLHEFLRRKRPS